MPMNPSRPRRPVHDVIDEILDGECAPDRHERLMDRVRRDARASEELARTRLPLDRLADEPLEMPDLSADILSQVHARRRFLPERARKLVTAGRLGVAAGLVGTIGVASFVQRHLPEVSLPEGPAPVSRLVEAATPESHTSPRLSEQTLDTIRASLGVQQRSHLNLSSEHASLGPTHLDLSVTREYPGQRGTSVFEVGPFADAIETHREPAHDFQPQLLDSFGPLLIYLREPPARLPEDFIEDRADQAVNE